MASKSENSFLFWLQGYYGILAAVAFTNSFRKFSFLQDSATIFNLNSKAYAFALLFSLIIVCFYTISNPEKALGRRLTFGIFLLFEIHFNTVGASTHLFQFWLWSCFMLSLIPSPQNSIDETWTEQHLKNGIRYAISIILVFYFFSGFWKTVGSTLQLLAGEPHFFTKQGLVYHIYSEILRADAKPLLQDYILKNRDFNVILSFGVIAIQMGALIGVFWTRFHRIIGYSLVIFHLGTALILDISYPTNFFLVIWALVLSPFVANHRVERHSLP